LQNTDEIDTVVDFTSILQADFYRADPSRKKDTDDRLHCLFALLGSSHIKAA